MILFESNISKTNSTTPFDDGAEQIFDEWSELCAVELVCEVFDGVCVGRVRRYCRACLPKILPIDHPHSNLTDHISSRSTHKRCSQYICLSSFRQHLHKSFSPIADSSIHVFKISLIHCIGNIFGL